MRTPIFALSLLALSVATIAQAKPAPGKYDACLDAIKLYFKQHPNGPAEETEFDTPSYAISGQQIVFTEKQGFKVYGPTGITVVNGRSCTYPTIDASGDDGLTQGIKRMLAPLAEPAYDTGGGGKVSRALFFKVGGVDVKVVDAMLRTCGKANQSLASFVGEALHPNSTELRGTDDQGGKDGTPAE